MKAFIVKRNEGLSTLLCNIVLEILASVIMQEKGIGGMKIREEEKNYHYFQKTINA